MYKWISYQDDLFLIIRNIMSRSLTPCLCNSLNKYKRPIKRPIRTRLVKGGKGMTFKSSYWHFIRPLRFRTLFSSDRSCRFRDKVRGDFSSTGTYEVGSFSTIGPHILGPTRRKTQRSRHHVHLVLFHSEIGGVHQKDSEVHN